MRRVLAGISVVLLLGMASTGCGKADDADGEVKPQVSLNPTGKPRDEKEAAQATAQAQMGQSAQNEMAKAAKAAAEAQAKSGGR